jgi:hypothetical protein
LTVLGESRAWRAAAAATPRIAFKVARQCIVKVKRKRARRLTSSEVGWIASNLAIWLEPVYLYLTSVSLRLNHHDYHVPSNDEAEVLTKGPLKNHFGNHKDATLEASAKSYSNIDFKIYYNRYRQVLRIYAVRCDQLRDHSCAHQWTKTYTEISTHVTSHLPA